MRRTAAVLLLGAVFALTGCGASSGIPELEREQVASDKLDLPARYFEDNTFDADSIRWLADHDGFHLYAARSDTGTCLIMVKGDDLDGSMAGCGIAEVGVSGRGFPTMHLYITPPSDAAEGVIELTPNLYVMGGVQE